MRVSSATHQLVVVQSSLAGMCQHACVQRHPPVDGGAGDERGELAQSLAEGVPNGGEAQHHVEVAANLVQGASRGCSTQNKLLHSAGGVGLVQIAVQGPSLMRNL